MITVPVESKSVLPSLVSLRTCAGALGEQDGEGVGCPAAILVRGRFLQPAQGLRLFFLGAAMLRNNLRQCSEAIYTAFSPTK